MRESRTWTTHALVIEPLEGRVPTRPPSLGNSVRDVLPCRDAFSSRDRRTRWILIAGSGPTGRLCGTRRWDVDYTVSIIVPVFQCTRIAARSLARIRLEVNAQIVGCAKSDRG